MLRASETVRYAEVAAAKNQVLRMLHAHFRDACTAIRRRARAAPSTAPFVPPRVRRSTARTRVFEAIQGTLHAADPAIWGWPVWPERASLAERAGGRRLRGRASPRKSTTTPTCSGSPTGSSPRRAAALRRARHGDRPLPRPRGLGRPRRLGCLGAGRRATRAARPSARRPTRSIRTARTGACRRCGPIACASTATRSSSPRCARRCATPARCASTT